MSVLEQFVVAGVDAHGDTHHAAVVDSVGRHVRDREFSRNAVGFVGLVAWVMAACDVQRVGVEGTGTYGAA